MQAPPMRLRCSIEISLQVAWVSSSVLRQHTNHWDSRPSVRENCLQVRRLGCGEAASESNEDKFTGHLTELQKERSSSLCPSTSVELIVVRTLSGWKVLQSNSFCPRELLSPKLASGASSDGGSCEAMAMHSNYNSP